MEETVVWSFFLNTAYFAFLCLLSVFMRESDSVRPSVTRVDQSKMVQARITIFSPSAAWKTLVSGTIKLFHKFAWGHPE